MFCKDIKLGAMNNPIPVYGGRVAGTPNSETLSDFYFKPLAEGMSDFLQC